MQDPTLTKFAHSSRPTFRRTLRGTAFKLIHPRKARFDCPICRYHGPFLDLNPATGKRSHAMCACCGALERHRLQYLVISKVLADIETNSLRMLHFAPEDFFRNLFSGLFGTYETADINMPGVDHTVDLQSLPFSANSYDIVYASHVLEHVPDDRRAILEIRRILAPGGIAILPVPLVCPATIEYPEPNPYESMHVRAPGPDYFDRFSPHFTKIDLYQSDTFPERHQLFIHEDRTKLPNQQSPLRMAMHGTKHIDIVPVCHV